MPYEMGMGKKNDAKDEVAKSKLPGK